ncbi:MAG: hypothetical protein OHK0024_32700 [Thalassobaculales bacterium]
MAGPEITLRPLPPADAVRYFQEKGFRVGFSWLDVWQDEHARAFTVAKAMRLDVLAAIREAVDQAIRDGTTFPQFQRRLAPILQAKGWWGRRPMTDPRTGETRMVQLGSRRRLEIIFDTNIRTSYAAGRWQQIQRTKAGRPWLVYWGLLDDRIRPEHRAWHGTCLPVDHLWWRTHYPPNGWRCRCTVRQMSARDLARLGIAPSGDPPADTRAWRNPRTGEVVQVPAGIDPGFAHNPGLAYRPPDPGAPAILPSLPRYSGWGRPDRQDVPPEFILPAPPTFPSLANLRAAGMDDEAARAEIERSFALAFGLAPGAREGVIRDVFGESVTVGVDMALDHIFSDHEGEGRERFWLHYRAAIERPYEVWLVPIRLRTGRVVVRQRYIGLFADADGRPSDALAVVDRGSDGWALWTAMRNSDLRSARSGWFLYGR